jgi:KamA family protein
MKINKLLKTNVRTLTDLKKYAGLSSSEERKLKEVIKIHPMDMTRYYMSLIDWNNKKDPIRKMMIPSIEELNTIGSYDTSDEAGNTKLSGLQHKYQQTALLLSTNRCAAYCRFCFRKRLVGLPSSEILKRFNDCVKYINENKQITNVLISGGDPLVLPTKILGIFLEKLDKIRHLRFIRFGSKVPVAFPKRIYNDSKLLKLFKKYSRKNKRLYIVTHFNHPREITTESIKAIDALINSNIIISNQTVLMKGVNDSPKVLAELMNRLTSIGVIPYYVFQCRPVSRVKHNFQLPLYKGYKIVEDAKKLLNGHAKRFKFVMSHKTGKVEIVGIDVKYIYFKYNQAKNPKNLGRFFKRRLNKTGCWLDDFEQEDKII